MISEAAATGKGAGGRAEHERGGRRISELRARSADELEDRLPGRGGAAKKRSAAAQKAATTRKRQATARSTAAKKAATTRAKKSTTSRASGTSRSSGTSRTSGTTRTRHRDACDVLAVLVRRHPPALDRREEELAARSPRLAAVTPAATSWTGSFACMSSR